MYLVVLTEKKNKDKEENKKDIGSDQLKQNNNKTN